MKKGMFRHMIVTAVLAILATPAFARPTSLQILQKMADTYRGMRSYRDKTVTTMDVKMEGKSQKMEAILWIAFSRPNRLRVQSKNPMFDSTMVSDGKNVWMYVPSRKQAMKQPLTGALGQLIGSSGASGGMNILLQMILADKPMQIIMEGVKSHKLLGTRKLGGRETYLVGMSQPGLGNIKLWIGMKDFLLYQATIDMTEMVKRQGGQGPSSMIVTEIHKNIQANQKLPASLFAFKPPAGVEVVGGFDSGPKGSSLVGKAAPDFTLKTLDGRTMRLSDLKGKTVLIDFWATWCGPCVEEIQHIQNIHRELSDKGLVVIGINDEQDKEMVKAFMKSKGIDFTVLHDEGSKVMQTYRVEAIPRLLIIGPDGIVKTDITGSEPEATIRQELAKAGIK